MVVGGAVIGLAKEGGHMVGTSTMRDLEIGWSREARERERKTTTAEGGRQGAVRCIGKPGHRRCTRQQSHNTLCPARRSRYIRCTAHVQRGSMTNLSFSFCLSVSPSISISSPCDDAWWQCNVIIIVVVDTCVAHGAYLITYRFYQRDWLLVFLLQSRYLGETFVQHAVV